MTTKKKTKKNQVRLKRNVVKKVAPKKKLAKKKVVPKKAGVKTKAGGEKPTGGKAASALKKRVPEKNRSVGTVAFAPEVLVAQSGEQSGDLQGLSNVQGAESESVDELLEEGNAFEAEVVKGVEDAGDAYEAEVRTHETPQDDVPDEYQDIEE